MYRFIVPMVDNGYKSGSQLRISPDGRTLYFRATADGRRFQIFRRRLDDLTAVPIEGTQDAGAYLPTADGRSLLLTFPGAVTRKVSVNGGPLETVAEGVPGVSAISGDGTILIGGDDRPVRRLLANHTVEDITALDTAHGENGHAFPWFLPDGKSFLFISVSRNAELGTIQHVLCGARLGSKQVTRIGDISSRVEYAMGHIFFVRSGTLDGATVRCLGIQNHGRRGSGCRQRVIRHAFGERLVLRRRGRDDRLSAGFAVAAARRRRRHRPHPEHHR